MASSAEVIPELGMAMARIAVARSEGRYSACIWKRPEAHVGDLAALALSLAAALVHLADFQDVRWEIRRDEFDEWRFALYAMWDPDCIGQPLVSYPPPSGREQRRMLIGLAVSLCLLLVWFA